MSGETVSRSAGTGLPAGAGLPATSAADGIRRWAALDKANERLVEPTHPLLVELMRARQGDQADLAQAS